MIKIFKADGGSLERINKFEKGSWIDISQPTKAEITRVAGELALPESFLEKPLDINERPRIEIEGGWTLLVLKTPQATGENESIPFITLPIGIIFSKDFIITVCSREDDVILKLYQIKNFVTVNKNWIILQIFYLTAIQFLSHLRRISAQADLIERGLHRSMKNEELIKLLNLEKSLVYFTTSLRANELMIERLQRSELLKLQQEDKELLDDVITENKQAIEMANIYSNILSGMMDAFASVISNNLNMVMKFLALVTIILMIPTLVASIYGMNIKLPFQNSPYAFFITMGASLILSALGIIIFFKRKWF
jgi:magnesium transporter